jgi:phosphoglycerate dehydrogenase-like enzyme
MKPSAVLINTCRGPVVNEAAVHEALKAKRIAMAGLDVMTEEPPKAENPLFVLPNVILTPHAAGPTVENWADRFRNGFDNIQRVQAGRKPKWVVPELEHLVK